jgi:hypothetical protein
MPPYRAFALIGLGPTRGSALASYRARFPGRRVSFTVNIAYAIVERSR